MQKKRYFCDGWHFWKEKNLALVVVSERENKRDRACFGRGLLGAGRERWLFFFF